MRCGGRFETCPYAAARAGIGISIIIAACRPGAIADAIVFGRRGELDDAVQMIRHDDEGIQLDVWIVGRKIQPAFAYDSGMDVFDHPAIGDIAKERHVSVMNADGDEIIAGSRVIIAR